MLQKRDFSVTSPEKKQPRGRVNTDYERHLNRMKTIRKTRNKMQFDKQLKSANDITINTESDTKDQRSRNLIPSSFRSHNPYDISTIGSTSRRVENNSVNEISNFSQDRETMNSIYESINQKFLKETRIGNYIDSKGRNLKKLRYQKSQTGFRTTLKLFNNLETLNKSQKSLVKELNEYKEKIEQNMNPKAYYDKQIMKKVPMWQKNFTSEITTDT